MQAAANSFGKALDTPIQGMASLSRYGFVFTEQEKAMVKALEEAGKHQEAQKIILHAMEGSFGNAANAVNDAAKAQNDYSSAMSAMKIAVGEAAAPVDSFVKNVVTSFITAITKSITLTNDYKKAMSNLKEDNYAEGEVGQYQKLNDELDVYANKLATATNTKNSLDERGRDSSAYDKQIASINAAITATQKEITSIEERRNAVQAAAAEAAANAAVAEQNAAAEQARQDKLAEAMKKANETLQAQTTKYNQSLEELHLKNDENKNDERQLLELQLAREEAGIRASKADAAAKDAAIAALRELYAEKLKSADDTFEAAAQNAKIKAQQDSFKLLIDQYKEYLDTQREADTLDLDKQMEFLQEKTNILLEQNMAEQDALNAQLAEFKAAADEAELAANEDQLTKMQEQALRVQEQLSVNEEQKSSILSESAKKQAAIEKALADEKEAIQTKYLQSTVSIFSTLSSIMATAGKESREAAIAEKALAIAKATIQTYLAAQSSFAAGGGFPWGLIPMAAAIAQGVANVAAIAAQPIPSAETGGSFIAKGSPGVDTNLIRVNNGERIDVTPAGQFGQSSGGYSGDNSAGLQSFKDYFWDLVNEGFRAGAIYAMPTGNL
jgi:hypothetical protein